MAIARFKDVCLDAPRAGALASFWAAVLGWRSEVRDDGVAFVEGPSPSHRLWVNPVPEPKLVKHRVHLDVYTRRLEDLEDLGSSVLLPEAGGRRWTVMADPAGGEFCAFLRDELPPERLHGLVVDCKDPAALARWWGEVYDSEVVDHPEGYSTVQHVEGMPIATFDFVPVPEAKTGKNRVHWDVTVASIGPLVDAGAASLRAPNEDISWHVMADPEGNEFCAFVRE